MKRSRIRIILSLGTVLLLTNVVAAQTVLYVDTDAPGDNDGTSWLHAFRDLQDALAAGLPGGEIHVAQGEYKPAGADGDRDAAFHLPPGVALLGGYAGYGEADPDARDIAAYETILSGDLNGDDGPDFANNTENAYHVVVAWSVDETAILEGFTVRAGNADGDQMGNRHTGGGLLNMGGSPTVTACTLRENQANYGAGMTNIAGAPVVTGCTFRGNHAAISDAFAGGVLNIAGSPTFTDCLLEDNSAEFAGGMANVLGSSPMLDGCVFRNNEGRCQGGGMGSILCSLTLHNCTFEGNRTTSAWPCGAGGGIYSEESRSVLTGCAFVGNHTSSSAGDGGGLCVRESLSLHLANCTFTENLGEYGGGVYAYTQSDASIEECTFAGNTSRGSGGGLSFYAPEDFSIIDCTFSGNTSGAAGGGLYCRGQGETDVTNCLFTDNWTLNAGGGAAASSARPIYTKCVFSGNSASRGGGLDEYNGFSVVHQCAFWGNEARNRGGAISITSKGELLCTNCLIAGNEAEDSGGAIYSWSSSHSDPCEMRLLGCTLTANEAPSGRTLACDSLDHDRPGDLTISSSILWNGGDEIVNNDGSEIEVSFSDVAGGWPGPGNIDADPLLVDQAGPDGVPGTVDDDLHLLPASPCINAGSNYAPDLPKEDFEDSPRIQNCRVDIGAYESPHPPLAPADCNDNGEDDDCELYDGTSADCNYNHVPDECDIADGSSYDWNDNGLPDECECEGWQCCEFLPDQPVCYGDVNGDGFVTFLDAGLVQAAFGAISAESLCRYDVNCDGTIDSYDLASVLVVQGPCEPDSLPPCPWLP